MYAVSLPLRQTLNDMNMEIVSIEKKTFEMMVAIGKLDCRIEDIVEIVPDKSN